MQKSRRVRVQVPATTANCGPGFDTLGIACDLYNEVELELCSERDLVQIDVSGDGADSLPTNDRNLVLRSVRAVLEQNRSSGFGIRLQLLNRIPLSRGLGSSSSAIIGGLVAANAALEYPFSSETLLDMATRIEGHPDNVAPALYGGFTVSVLQSDRVVCLRMRAPQDLKLVVCIPDFRLSTQKARQAIPDTIPHKDAVFNVSRTALLVGALATGQTKYLADALEDRLHQPYRAPLIPGMNEVFVAGCRAGALGVTMSGAGPSIMAYTLDQAATVGQSMVDAFEAHGVASRFLELNIDYAGAKVLD